MIDSEANALATIRCFVQYQFQIPIRPFDARCDDRIDGKNFKLLFRIVRF